MAEETVSKEQILEAINKVIDRLDHARDTALSTLIILADQGKQEGSI